MIQQLIKKQNVQPQGDQLSSYQFLNEACVQSEDNQKSNNQTKYSKSLKKRVLQKLVPDKSIYTNSSNDQSNCLSLFQNKFTDLQKQKDLRLLQNNNICQQTQDVIKSIMNYNQVLRIRIPSYQEQNDDIRKQFNTEFNTPQRKRSEFQSPNDVKKQIVFENQTKQNYNTDKKNEFPFLNNKKNIVGNSLNLRNIERNKLQNENYIQQKLMKLFEGIQSIQINKSLVKENLIHKQQFKTFLSWKYGDQKSELLLFYFQIPNYMDLQRYFQLVNKIKNTNEHEILLLAYLFYDVDGDGYISNTDIDKLNQLNSISNIFWANSIKNDLYKIQNFTKKQINQSTFEGNIIDSYYKFSQIQNHFNQITSILNINQIKIYSAYYKKKEKIFINDQLFDMEFFIGYQDFLKIFENIKPFIYYDLIYYVSFFKFSLLQLNYGIDDVLQQFQ